METNDQHNRRSYDVEVALIKAKFESFEEKTTEYRKESIMRQELMLKSLHELISRFDKLPCFVHKTIVDQAMKHIYALWAIVGVGFIALLSDFFKRKP